MDGVPPPPLLPTTTFTYLLAAPTCLPRHLPHAPARELVTRDVGSMAAPAAARSSIPPQSPNCGWVGLLWRDEPEAGIVAVACDGTMALAKWACDLGGQAAEPDRRVKSTTVADGRTRRARMYRTSAPHQTRCCNSISRFSGDKYRALTSLAALSGGGATAQNARAKQPSRLRAVVPPHRLCRLRCRTARSPNALTVYKVCCNIK